MIKLIMFKIYGHKFLSPFVDPFISILEDLGEFIISLLSYFFHKLDNLLMILHAFTLNGVVLSESIKFYTLSRLILSRGRYGERVRDFTVFSLIITIFLLGGIFQGSLVSNASNESSDFISTNSVLSGYISITTQSGEKVLLNAPVEHIVQDGETLHTIGKKYGISYDSIQFANNLKTSSVKVGQKLLIPPVEGTLHTVKKGETVESISKLYGVPSQAIVDSNYLDEPYVLTMGSVITVPNAQKPAETYYSGRDTYGTSAYGLLPKVGNVQAGTGQFNWPFSGILTQGYNPYHHAIDIAAHTGDVKAADKGTVVRSGWWEGGYGNAVQIDHGNGYVTTYAHMSVLSVSSGENVDKGQKIGVVGSTGRSTGPHVHFTIQKDGMYLNPLEYLR